MAEALGIASGVAGLVSLGIELCQSLLDYYGSWKDSEDEVMTTYSSIEELTKILLLVNSTLENKDIDPEILVQVQESIALCKGGIANLDKKLQKIQLHPLRDVMGERFRSQAWRILYPFKKSTLIKLQELVEDLRDKLHLTLTTLGINISLQNFDIITGQLQSLSTGVDKTQLGIGNIQDTLAGLDRKVDTIESLYSNEYFQGFCKWLSPIFDTFERRQHDIFELPSRQDGTWRWLQGTEQFKNWLSSTDRILWCPGQPGVGKTVLASSIINHLETQVKQPGIGIAYVYCDYSNALLTVLSFIASLLHQLFLQSPKVPDRLLELYKSYTTKTIHLSLKECSMFLRDVIESFSKVFVVVDGLDECPHRGIDDIRGEFLDQLKGLPLKIQLLFTSRDLPAIALKFEADQRLEIRASRHAIEGYIQARINSSKNLSHHIRRKPSLRQTIVETVARKADGMFLLARMYIDLLATKSVLGVVEFTLNNLPEGLKDLDTAYDDVVTRIQNQDEDDVTMAKQILTWLYYAARPLTLQELRHSLAVNLVVEVEPDAIELDEAFLPDEEVIVSVCAGIVTFHVESNTVSFIHYTTKEYFKRRMERREVERFLRLEISIAETCLMYLTFERNEFEQFLGEELGHHRSSRFRQYAEEQYLDRNIDICYPLFRYAARHWGDHTNGPLRQITKDLAMKFLRQRTALAASVLILAGQEYESHPFPILISGLCVASFFGLKEIVMILLEDGEIIEAKNEHNWTALHMAAERGHAVIVQLLIDKGASVNAVTEVPSNSTSGATALHRAAGNGHEKVLEVLLENSAEIDLQTEGGETPLHWAAKKGHRGTIALLLSRGASLETKSTSGFTPLCCAVWYGEEASTKILIERGADLSATANGGHSVLFLAAEGGNVEIVQLLLESGFDVNSTDATGQSPLWAAAGSHGQGRDDVVRLLLKKGADVSKRTPSSGETALHNGTWRGSNMVVRLLLDNGADVAAQNDYGETALHIAAENGYEAVLQTLLEKGADVAAKNKEGETALHKAAYWGHLRIVQLLMESGADAKVVNNEEETALKLAAWSGHQAVVRHLLDHLDGQLNPEAWLATSQVFDVATAGDETAMRLLLDKGADVTVKDRLGNTALHKAARKGHVTVSRILLDNGAKIDAMNSSRMAPISFAASYGHVEVVRLLIKRGANLKRRDSPLFDAITSNKEGQSKVEIVQLLLENGADASAKNPFLNTPLHIAARQGYGSIITLLLKYGAVVGLQNDEGETALDIGAKVGGDILNLLQV